MILTIFQADLLRLAVGLLAGWSLIMTLAILWAFTKRTGWGIGWRSAILRKRTHILLVSVSFVILSVYAIAEVYQRVGTPLTWRGPVLLAAFLISGLGQYSMLTAQMQEGRGGYVGAERRHGTSIPTEPVLELIERVLKALARVEINQASMEGRQMTGADLMARMEDTAHHVAADLSIADAKVAGVASDLISANAKVADIAANLEHSQARADTVKNGQPGEAADAGAQSGNHGP